MYFYSAYLTILEYNLYGIHSVIHMRAWSVAHRADRLQISYTEEKQSLSMCFTWLMWKSKVLFKAERTLFSTTLCPKLLQTRAAKATTTTDAAEDQWSQERFPAHSAVGLVHIKAWDVILHLWNSTQHWWVSTGQYNLYSLCMDSMYHGCSTACVLVLQQEKEERDAALVSP